MSIYMKINGVKGNVTAKGYEECIEIYDFESETVRPTSQVVGRMQDRSPGKINFSKLTFTKAQDTATHALVNKLYDGRVFDQIEVHQCTTGDQPSCFAKHTFYDVMVTQQRKKVTSEGAMESYEFSFSKKETGFSIRNSKNQVEAPKYIGYNLDTAEVL